MDPFAPSVCDFIFELPCTCVKSYARLYVKTRISFFSYDSVRMSVSAAAAARKAETDHVEVLRVAAKDAKKKYKRLLRVRVDGESGVR